MKPCIYNVFTAPTFENLVKLSISSYLNVKGCTISEGYTSVMDLYSRKIISWVLSEALEASHVVECVEKANVSEMLKTVDLPQNHHQELDLPNLMAKSVDKARQIRYNFYGILCILSYLIIPWIADSSESVFYF